MGDFRGAVHRLTPVQVEEILAWHRTRVTVKDMAARYGVSEYVLHYVIQRAGKGYRPASLPQTVQERFEKKVTRTAGCWLWMAGRRHFGHGNFRLNGRGIAAHRYSWMLYVGPIPPGLWVLHKCDNPPCVNPAHLYLGTSKDNWRDCRERHRHNPPKGERQWAAKLDEDKVREIRRIGKSMTQKAIAEQFGVTPGAIGGVLRGANWRHISD